MDKERGTEKDFRVTDRRFWALDKDERRQRAERHEYPTYVEELKARTELAERRLQEKIEELRSDNEALRIRLTKESERQLLREKEKLFAKFLVVIDNFERALDAAGSASDVGQLREGVALNLDLLLRELRTEGVEELDIQNKEYNPHESESLGFEPVDDPEMDQKVVQVLQKGYRLGDSLLRPARVRVGQYSDD